MIREWLVLSFSDLIKAFATVDHKILKFILHCLVSIELIESYLLDGMYIVKIADHSLDIESGKRRSSWINAGAFTICSVC